MSFTLDTFRYLNIHTENFINVQGKYATTEKKNVVAPCLQCDLEEHSSHTKNDMK